MYGACWLSQRFLFSQGWLCTVEEVICGAVAQSTKVRTKPHPCTPSPCGTNTYIKSAADGLADLTCTKVSRTSRSYTNVLRSNTFICQCQWETNSHREAQVLLELKLFLLSVNVTCMSRNHVRCWGSSIHIRGAIKNYLEKAMDSRSNKTKQ
jgi:hypothetical protein